MLLLSSLLPALQAWTLFLQTVLRTALPRPSILPPVLLLLPDLPA